VTGGGGEIAAEAERAERQHVDAVLDQRGGRGDAGLERGHDLDRGQRGAGLWSGG